MADTHVWITGANSLVIPSSTPVESTPEVANPPMSPHAWPVSLDSAWNVGRKRFRGVRVLCKLRPQRPHRGANLIGHMVGEVPEHGLRHGCDVPA